MNTYIFDGRKFAREKEVELKEQVDALKNKAMNLKLVTILVGDNPASEMYVNMKKKAGERIGIDVDIVNLGDSVHFNELIQRIKKLNNDKSVNGIMIQLPLPEKFADKDREKLINSIDKKKDVDGLRNDSLFVTPTVKSVLYVLKQAFLLAPCRGNPCKVMIVGYMGFEGGKIYKALKEMLYEVSGADIKTKNLRDKTKNADILISVTGIPCLIKKSMVKEGCILIDVGAPRGDIDKGAFKKASFVSPVPGGVGPLTIINLLENLIDTC